MAVNLTHLAAFHAVAETGSISRGADRLMVSQPGVSKQVHLLERALGARLFDRNARGVRLTAAGQTLKEYATRIFVAAGEAELALSDLAELRAGKISIGASTTIGTYLLPEIFVAYRMQFPGVRMTMEIASSSTISNRVAAGEFDIGFVETLVSNPDIASTVQGNDQMVGIVSPDHPLAGRKRATSGQFCAEPFVVRDTASETKSFVERALAGRGLTVRPVMSLTSTEAIKRAVAAGVGVAIVSRLSIALELKARTLVAVRLSDLNISRPLYRIAPARRATSKALEAFLQLMAQAIR